MFKINKNLFLQMLNIVFHLNFILQTYDIKHKYICTIYVYTIIYMYLYRLIVDQF